MELGESLEDYLEAMLVLSKEGKIKSVDVANKLGVSKPSVNKAISILKTKGYVQQESYGDIHITDTGKEIASKVLDRHLHIKRFLIEVLGVDESNADLDACKIEHVVSETTYDKMRDYRK